MLRKVISGIIITTLTLSFIGCAGENNSSAFSNNDKKVVAEQKKEKETIEESLQRLNTAKEISLEENILTYNNSYDVKINDKKFGSINGEYIHFTGDTFTFTNNNDLEIASEKQIKRWGIKLNRLAEIYDANGEVSGYIGEEKINDLFKIGYKFHFYDKDKNELGYIKKQYFSILDHFDIYNMENEIVYTIDKDLTMFADRYTIKVIDNKDISADKAIFATAIMHAIEENINNKEN